jgi:hypothetical protein
MTAIPSLYYLKRGLFRSLVGSAHSDAQIAKTVFGTHRLLSSEIVSDRRFDRSSFAMAETSVNVRKFASRVFKARQYRNAPSFP